MSTWKAAVWATSSLIFVVLLGIMWCKVAGAVEMKCITDTQCQLEAARLCDEGHIEYCVEEV